MSKDELIATIEKAFGVTSHDQYPRFLECIGMSLARCADILEAEKKPRIEPKIMPVPAGLTGIFIGEDRRCRSVPLVGCYVELVGDGPEFNTYYIMPNGSTITDVHDAKTDMVYGMDCDVRGVSLQEWGRLQ